MYRCSDQCISVIPAALRQKPLLNWLMRRSFAQLSLCRVSECSFVYTDVRDQCICILPTMSRWGRSQWTDRWRDSHALLCSGSSGWFSQRLLASRLYSEAGWYVARLFCFASWWVQLTLRLLLDLAITLLKITSCITKLHTYVYRMPKHLCNWRLIWL